RTADVDVPTVATRSSERLPRLDMPANKSSDDVFAATVVQPGVTIDPQTTLPSPQDAKSGGKKTAIIAAVAALGIAAVVTGFFMSRPEAAQSDSLPKPANSATNTVVSAAPTIAPVVPASAAPAASAAASDTVELRFKATPENLDVFIGERNLGTTLGPIQVPKGDTEISLTFTAKGFQSKSIPVKPSQNREILISLDKSVSTAKPPPTKTGNNGDLLY
ncbi:MAG TPA: hypothetical protein PK156_46400, partial [Polyangium sp.]|nr:hypothetical protein [Polyangium sp.]